MCGITGYIGGRDAYPIVINGPKRLEYRGYDSSGIMMFDGKEMNLSKVKGKVSDLEDVVNTQSSRKIGKIGILKIVQIMKSVPQLIVEPPLVQWELQPFKVLVPLVWIHTLLVLH